MHKQKLWFILTYYAKEPFVEAGNVPKNLFNPRLLMYFFLVISFFGLTKKYWDLVFWSLVAAVICYYWNRIKNGDYGAAWKEYEKKRLSQKFGSEQSSIVVGKK